MLAQVLLGSVEAGLQSASPLDLAAHHEAGAADTSGAAADHLAAAAGDGTGEDCDHCCQCHGHGSHFAAAARLTEIPASRRSNSFIPHPSRHSTTFLAVPLRPPIA